MVQVQPLPEPDPQAPGSKLGSDWVQKVQELDHGQSTQNHVGITKSIEWSGDNTIVMV